MVRSSFCRRKTGRVGRQPCPGPAPGCWDSALVRASAVALPGMRSCAGLSRAGQEVVFATGMSPTSQVRAHLCSPVRGGPLPWAILPTPLNHSNLPGPDKCPRLCPLPTPAAPSQLPRPPPCKGFSTSPSPTLFTVHRHPPPCSPRVAGTKPEMQREWGSPGQTARGPLGLTSYLLKTYLKCYYSPASKPLNHYPPLRPESSPRPCRCSPDPRACSPPAMLASAQDLCTRCSLCLAHSSSDHLPS